MSALPVTVFGVESCIDCSLPGRLVVHGIDDPCPRQRQYHAQHCTVCFRREVWTTALVCRRDYCRRTYFARLARRVSPPRLSEAGVTTPLSDPGSFSADPDGSLRLSGQGRPVSGGSKT